MTRQCLGLAKPELRSLVPSARRRIPIWTATQQHHHDDTLVMPPRRRQQYTQESIDQQLQQIHLLDASSSENLEQLGPIIKQIHANRQQEVYLRNLQALIEAKDAEIESICTENYQEFISSISTLFTIKSYTTNLREKITTLDESVGHLGKGLVEKKRSLLQSKKTASNLDEAIDTFQACLKLLDVVDRIGDMIKEGRFWSALRVSRTEIVRVPHAKLLLFQVFGRHSDYAVDIAVANPAIPAYIVFLAFASSPGTKCCYCIHETVAT